MIRLCWCVGTALGVLNLNTINAQTRSAEPSNTAEVVAKKRQTEYDVAADGKRKAEMTPDELAWETLLEQNLGSFYLPLYKQAKIAGKETEWDFVKDDPKLPRVLLIGDSISRGYTLVVRHSLAGKANLHRAPANCGSTAMGLKDLPIWLGARRWDVIHFNFGIWDRKTPQTDYAANLERIVDQLERTGARLIWASTTPPLNNHNAEKYSQEECSNLNRIADEIMKRRGIPKNDLCGAIGPRLAEMQLSDNVHFRPAGYEVLGHQVAASILARLQDAMAAPDRVPGAAAERKP